MSKSKWVILLMSCAVVSVIGFVWFCTRQSGSKIEPYDLIWMACGIYVLFCAGRWQAQRRLANTLFVDCHPELFWQDFKRAAKAPDDDSQLSPQLAYWRATVLRETGRTVEALALLEQAIAKTEPESRDAVMLGQFRTVVRLSVARNAGDAQAYRMLADEYSDDLATDEQLNRTAKNRRMVAETKVYLQAMLALLDRDVERGRPLWDQATKWSRKPMLACNDLYWKAQFELLAGNRDVAIEHLRTVVKKGGTLAVAERAKTQLSSLTTP